MIRTCSSFAVSLPCTSEGSGKLQCIRVAGPGKIGHFSAFASSHTVMTWAKSWPDLKTSKTAWVFLLEISYAVFCLKKKKHNPDHMHKRKRILITRIDRGLI